MVSPPTLDLEEIADSRAARPVVARVLHVINGQHYSGAERVQDLLAAQLPNMGFDVGFACVKADLFPKMRQTQTAPLHELGMKGRFDLRPARKLAKLVRAASYDLLHAHTPRTALLAAIASSLTHVPMVYHVHSPASRDSTQQLRNWLNARLERLCLRQASAAITVSESLRRDTLSRGMDATRVFVVPNGVPSRRLRPPRTPDDPTWTLGTVALFRPRKGTEILLKALAALRKADLPVRLRAVGGFETAQHEQGLKRLAADLGVSHAVDWTGFTQDVDQELGKMDLFILPSLFGEGLPMVVLEAMAAGVPVIASRVEGTPETIRHGLDGLIVDPGDPRALTSAVREFIDGQVDWSALRRSAAGRHAEKFSDRAMAAGTARVYRHVLNLDGERPFA